ncbi:hypothetical protein ABFA07_019628 [Porites harrisoni]
MTRAATAACRGLPSRTVENILLVIRTQTAHDIFDSKHDVISWTTQQRRQQQLMELSPPRVQATVKNCLVGK